ncbi:hypothetical protein M419DRAFT_119018, partial [Trichoderma reesei RUT C-30]
METGRFRYSVIGEQQQKKGGNGGKIPPGDLCFQFGSGSYHAAKRFGGLVWEFYLFFLFPSRKRNGRREKKKEEDWQMES